MTFYADIHEAFPSFEWSNMKSEDCHYLIKNPPKDILGAKHQESPIETPKPYQNVEAFQPPLSSVIDTSPWRPQPRHIQEKEHHYSPQYSPRYSPQWASDIKRDPVLEGSMPLYSFNEGDLRFNDLDRLLFVLTIGIGLLIALDYATKYLRLP